MLLIDGCPSMTPSQEASSVAQLRNRCHLFVATEHSTVENEYSIPQGLRPLRYGRRKLSIFKTSTTSPP